MRGTPYLALLLLLTSSTEASLPPDLLSCHREVCGPKAQQVEPEDDDEGDDAHLTLKAKAKIKKVAETVYDAHAAYLTALPELVKDKTQATEAERINTSLQIAMTQLLRAVDSLGLTRRLNDLSASIPGILNYSYGLSSDPDFLSVLTEVQQDADRSIENPPSLARFRDDIDAILKQLDEPESRPYYVSIPQSYRAVLQSIRRSSRPIREEISEVYYIRAAIRLIDAARTKVPLKKKLLVYDLFGEIRRRELFLKTIAGFAKAANNPDAKKAYVEDVVESCVPSFDTARKLLPRSSKKAAFGKIERQTKQAVIAVIQPYLPKDLFTHAALAIQDSPVAWPLTFQEYQSLLLKRFDIEAKVSADHAAPLDTSLMIDQIVGMNLIGLKDICDQYAIDEDYTDQIRMVDRSVYMSARSVRDGNSAGNLAHELAHQVEFELMIRFPNVDPFTATHGLRTLGTCLKSQQKNGTTYLSEDFADFIAARVPSFNENRHCQVYPFEEWENLKDPLSQSDPSQEHSGPLYRILQWEMQRKGTVPLSCQAHLKTTEFNFRDCGNLSL